MGNFCTAGKGNYLQNTFFAIWAEQAGSSPVARVLESKIRPPYSRSHGFVDYEVGGLPRLDGSRMKGEYPFVTIEFTDERLPVQVTLEAFTPFIPLNADDFGHPDLHPALHRPQSHRPTGTRLDRRVTVQHDHLQAVQPPHLETLPGSG